jgi:hypothetical protein
MPTKYKIVPSSFVMPKCRRRAGSVKKLPAGRISVENRSKRETLQEQRTEMAVDLVNLGKSRPGRQRAIPSLLQSVESALQRAGHAEKWEWKETETPSGPCYCSRAFSFGSLLH